MVLIFSADFVSSLACAAASTSPCSIKLPQNSSLEVTCVCNTALCNTPFSPEFRNELLNFTFTNSSTDMMQIFFKSTKFGNVTDENIYKAITIEVTEATTTTARNLSQPTTVMVSGTINIQSILRDSEKPRAEPLKQEPTAPSDDDEDESEGSGAYEESRVHNHAVSAPAAPSSFLPANENSATKGLSLFSLYSDLLLTTLFIYLVV